MTHTTLGFSAESSTDRGAILGARGARPSERRAITGDRGSISDERGLLSDDRGLFDAERGPFAKNRGARWEITRLLGARADRDWKSEHSSDTCADCYRDSRTPQRRPRTLIRNPRTPQTRPRTALKIRGLLRPCCGPRLRNCGLRSVGSAPLCTESASQGAFAALRRPSPPFAAAFWVLLCAMT